MFCMVVYLYLLSMKMSFLLPSNFEIIKPVIETSRYMKIRVSRIFTILLSIKVKDYTL